MKYLKIDCFGTIDAKRETCARCADATICADFKPVMDIRLKEAGEKAVKSHLDEKEKQKQKKADEKNKQQASRQREKANSAARFYALVFVMLVVGFGLWFLLQQNH